MKSPSRSDKRFELTWLARAVLFALAAIVASICLVLFWNDEGIAYICFVIIFASVVKLRMWRGDKTNAQRHKEECSVFPAMALAFRAECLWSIGERQKAVDDLSEAIFLTPADWKVSIVRGFCLESNGQLEFAKSDYNQAVLLNDQEALSYVRRGDVAIKSQQLREALDDYNKAIELLGSSWPSNSEPLYGSVCIRRGDLLAKMGCLSAAIADYYRVLEIDGFSDSVPIVDSPDALVGSKNYLHLGDTYFSRSEFLNAIINYSLAISKDELSKSTVSDDFVSDSGNDPSRDQLSIKYIRRASAYFQIGFFQSALDDCSKAIATATGLKCQHYLSRAEISYHIGNDEDVVSDCDAAIQISPDNALAHSMRGLAKQRQRSEEPSSAASQADLRTAPNGDLQAQIECETAQISADSKNFWSYFVRGTLHQAGAEWSQAVNDYTAALAIYPKGLLVHAHHLDQIERNWLNRLQTEVSTQYNLRITNGQTEDNTKAAFSALLIAKEQHARPELALETLTRRLENEGNNADLYELRGDIFLRLQQYKNASEDYQHAAGMAPRKVLLFQKLADALHHDRMCEEACRKYRHFLELLPSSVLQFEPSEDVYLSVQDSSFSDTYHSDEIVGSSVMIATALLERGQLYAELGDSINAQADFDNARQFATDEIVFPPSNHDSKRVHLFLKSLDLANSAPTTASELIARGDARFVVGREEEAIWDYRSAIDSHEELPLAHIRIADADLLSTRNIQQSLSNYLHAVQLHPDGEKFWELVAELELMIASDYAVDFGVAREEDVESGDDHHSALLQWVMGTDSTDSSCGGADPLSLFAESLLALEQGMAQNALLPIAQATQLLFPQFTASRREFLAVARLNHQIRKVSKKLLELYKDMAWDLIARAQARFQLDLLPDALIDYDTAKLFVEPESFASLELHEGRGEVLLYQHKFEAALAAYEEALDARGWDNTRFYLKLGIIFDLLGSHQKAIEHYTLCIDDLEYDSTASSYFSEALVRRGMLFAKIVGFGSKAREDFARAAFALSDHGNQKLNACDRKISSAKTPHWSFHADRADCLRELGRFQESLKDSDLAIRVLVETNNNQSSTRSFRDDLCRLYVGRAQTNKRLEKNEEARSDCTKALDLDPKNWTALAIRGDVLLKLGRRADAMRDYTEALSLSSRPSWALMKQAIAYISNEEFDQALEILNVAIHSAPRVSWGYLLRAELNAAQEKYDEALRDLTKGVSLEEHSLSGACLKARGDLYYSQGRFAEASEDYRELARKRSWSAWL